uniref:Uncharacterized protein n=1 Tax=Eptatretus burgeri TaxID=7764 RepID=A0A8C4NDC5_EPTBU
MAPLRVLELYSGVGGLHCALRECMLITIRVHQGLTAHDFDKLHLDMILMSPPCQHEFTRTLELCRYTFREFHLSPTTVCTGAAALVFT